jgi:nucleoside-diphosphate-sugar epimerase
MIHVADLVEAVLQAAETDVRSGSIFFVSDGEIHTWSEIVSILEGHLGVRTRKVRIPVGLAWLMALGWEIVCRVRRVPPLLNRQKVREIQQVGWTCDIQEAVRKLHFTPRIPLQEGLEETYRWYLDRGWI